MDRGVNLSKKLKWLENGCFFYLFGSPYQLSFS